MSIFDPREMLKIAIMDEETGMAFYHSLASATRRPDVQSECIAIGKQEEMHAQRFRKMLDDLGGYTPQEEYSGQYEAYLTALIAVAVKMTARTARTVTRVRPGEFICRLF